VGPTIQVFSSRNRFGIATGRTISLTAQLATDVLLTLNAHASQSADLLQIKTSTGTVIVKADVNGAGVFGGSTVLGRVTAYTLSAGAKGFVARGAASQTANLIELQDSTTAILFSVGADGKVLLPDGTASLPALAFVASGEQDTGIYRIPSNALGISCGGTLTLTIAATVITPAVKVYNVSGSAADPSYGFAGDGTCGMYRVGSGVVGLSGNGAVRLSIGNGVLTVADGTNFTFGTGTGTKFGDSTSAKLGWWNATPVVKGSVTGSRGGNAALASLLTLLASYGLLTDSSTA